MRLPPAEELAAEDLADDRSLVIEPAEVSLALVNQLELGAHGTARRAANGRVERRGEDALVHAARPGDGQMVEVVVVVVLQQQTLTTAGVLHEAQAVDGQIGGLLQQPLFWTAASTARAVEGGVAAAAGQQTVAGGGRGEGDRGGGC